MTQPPHISLDISIVCYHSPLQLLLSTLRTALVSLKKIPVDAALIDYRILLLDNSEDQSLQLQSLDSLRDLAAEVNCELRLLQGHGNVGYGGAQNMAITASVAKYHLLLNPDVELDVDALLYGISYLELNPAVLVVSPHASYSDGRKQYLCKRYPTVLDFVVRGFFPEALKKLMHKKLAHFEMHELSEEQPSDAIPIVSGCFMLCRGEALRTVGGFDEDYFMYFEDFDLSLRLGKLGKIAYLPEMKITHHGGNSARKGIKHIGMFVRSGIRFFNQYGWRFIQ